jgi:WD40 repeat protein
VHPEGGYAISGSNDGSMVIWDLEQGREFMRLLGNREAVYELQYSPDGAFIYAALDDGTLRRYRVATGREGLRFEGHRRAVRSFALSPDGHTLLTADAEGVLILWDVPSGRRLNRFDRGQPVVSAAFHPQLPLVLTGGADGTVNVWRALSLDDLPAWVKANRYVSPLSCEQQAAYNLELDAACG